MKKFTIFIICLSLFTCIQSFAQEKEEEKKEETQVSLLEEEGPDPVGEYVYQPLGRRDPFVSLIKGSSKRLKKKPGLAGFAIDEIILEGIVEARGRHFALVKGPGQGRPYRLEVGTQVYDGEVIKIDKNTVVFKRILTVAMGGTKIKLVEKKLNPDQEQEEVLTNEQ